MKYTVVVAMVMLFAPEVFAGDPAEASGHRWPAEKAWQWYKQQPWLCGFNYIPARAIIDKLSESQSWTTATIVSQPWA
jgi:hypothetical protein